jgi:hypothetical protein
MTTLVRRGVLLDVLRMKFKSSLIILGLVLIIHSMRDRAGVKKP